MVAKRKKQNAGVKINPRAGAEKQNKNKNKSKTKRKAII